MTRLSIATTSVPGDLGAKLATIAEVGFPAVELHEPDLTAFAGSTASVRGRAEDLGLSIDVLQPFHDLEGLTGTGRSHGLNGSWTLWGSWGRGRCWSGHRPTRTRAPTPSASGTTSANWRSACGSAACARR